MQFYGINVMFQFLAEKGIMRFIMPLLLVVLVYSSLNAQISNGSRDPKILGSIEVEGNRTISDDLIKLYSELMPLPKEVFAEDFSNAVNKLWNLQSFSDVQIYALNPADNVVDVMIKVEEYPSLNQIHIAGNKKVKEGDIKNLISLYAGQKISPSHVSSAIEKIKNLYIEKGYLLAILDAQSVVNKETNKVDVVYTINEGEKVKIEHINFSGNDNFNDKALRKQLGDTKENGLFRGGDFDRAKYEDDKKKLVGFYKKEGFRDAVVVSDSIYYSDDNKDMNLIIEIEEGDRYYFRNIEIIGNEKYDSDRIATVVGIEKGEGYNYDKLLRGRSQVEQLYYNNGHLFSTINIPERPVGEDSVDVQIAVYEGGPVKVNRINITGNTKTNDKVIRRELKIKPGYIFNYALIERSHRDISILNYFSFVDMKVDIRDEENVNLKWIVEERSTDTFNMSIGLSQRDGLVGGLGISMNNFIGNGQKLSLNWQFGQIFRTFQIGFTEPWLFDTQTLAGFSIFDIRRGGKFYGFNQQSTGASLQIGRRLRWPDDFFRGTWVYEYSQNSISNVEDDDDLQRFLINRLKTTRSSVMQVISRDSRINLKYPALSASFPSSGSTVRLSSKFSGGILGGTENFIKYELNSEWYAPAFWDLVLYNNVHLGLIDVYGEESNISLQELFFMGGSAMALGTSLRGYDERSVGPLSSSGNPLGGKTMMKLTTEIRKNVLPNPLVIGVLFAEAGNNWFDIDFVDPFDLKRSAGFGFRIAVPMMGMVGLDIGYGFDNLNADGKSKGWKTQFRFGQGF